jgi:hypothetical protein
MGVGTIWEEIEASSFMINYAYISNLNGLFFFKEMKSLLHIFYSYHF